MKRNKDDEKVLGPMFPRLHVNDTAKGGPRAPPRNKMALYEQLSIPSQRFNPSNTNSLVPPGSSSQGSGLERNMLVSHSTSTNLAEKFHTHRLGGATVNSSVGRLEQRKRARDKDDFQVPVFVSLETGQQPNAADLSKRENDASVEEENVFPDKDCGHHHASRSSRSLENDACSLQELSAGRQPDDNGCIAAPDSMRDIGEEILPQQKSLSYSEGNHSIPNETNNDSERRGDKTCHSLQLENGDKRDDVSENSMVDSTSGLDMSPDDVVGIIGQKCFLKARRTIVNQQRVFAVQVFELHRLIKVQRLIAGSPHLLLEDIAYIGEPSFRGSPAKKLSAEIIILSHGKHNGDSEKPSHKMERSAENAVGRTLISSVTNGSQPSNYEPFLGNPPPGPVNGDNKINSWCFPGHQWLLPVMSPSEGLIYKPYPGPGFTAPICGGCGPFGQTQMTANIIPPYGVTAPHQGFGVLPGAAPVCHSYFPPYGMQMMYPEVSGSAVEQMNQYTGPDFHAHSSPLSEGGANFNMLHEGNLPSEKNGGISYAINFQASKDTELQSSASHPGERDGASVAEGKNALPHLPTASTYPEGASQSYDTDLMTRVIKVVPHNRKSATESAARIFQSIQRERRQYDAV